MPEIFTMSQIQHLYEEILQHTFDRRNFAKKILRLGILVEAEARPENTPTRIPNKYRFDKDAYQALKQSSFMLEF
jgi:8-oxo-dGTP diphosphatase